MSELVSRSLCLGLSATQANLVPALCVEALIGGLGSEQPVPDARIPLEGRTFLLPERGGKVVPFQTIVRYHRPARFGVQLVFLDSDVRLDLLLPDHASVAPRNFGGSIWSMLLAALLKPTDSTEGQG